MNFNLTFSLYIYFIAVIAGSFPRAASAGIAQEANEMVAWIEQLKPPDPNAFPLVRVLTNEPCLDEIRKPPRDLIIDDTSWKSFSYIYGLLCEHTASDFVVFGADFRFYRFTSQRVPDHKNARSGLRFGEFVKLDLRTEVAARLHLYRDIVRPLDPIKECCAFPGCRLSVELSWLGWACQATKNDELAKETFDFLGRLISGNHARSTPSEVLQDTLSMDLIDQWFADVDNARVSPSDLQKSLEQYVKYFPLGATIDDKHTSYALKLQKTLQAINGRSEVDEPIGQRSQPRGRQLAKELWRVDDGCNQENELIRLVDESGTVRDPIVREILTIGVPAIPYLIDELTNTDLTHCVIYSSRSHRYDGVFRVRDCAWEIIRQILREDPDIRSWPQQCYSEDPNEIAEFHRKVQMWWADKNKS